MSSRLDPSWTVVTSVQTPGGDRCVDVFLRPSGSFGFEEFRRDPEDMGAWTPLHYYCEEEFTNLEAALRVARRRVPWFALLGDA